MWPACDASPDTQPGKGQARAEKPPGPGRLVCLIEGAQAFLTVEATDVALELSIISA